MVLLLIIFQIYPSSHK